MLTRAVESPLVRGGLTIVAGVLTGNVLGVGRVALIAYLLGTHSYADSLAVAMGPLDTLNSVLINSIVFAFVPMLTAAQGAERTALFLKLTRCFVWVFALVSAGVMLAAPWLMRVLAPGLDPQYFDTAVNILRILALSTVAAGVAAVHCALLYTDRRFGPAAFYQAALNVFTIAGALDPLEVRRASTLSPSAIRRAPVRNWPSSISRRDPGSKRRHFPSAPIRWREILMKPAFFVVYAAGIGLNITFTRAYATHAGPGMAAALDYCMRGVAVPLALLVKPISNSLLPEIARLRSMLRLRDALRLIDKTIALAALAAVAGCGFALFFRQSGDRAALPARQFHGGIHTAGGVGIPRAGTEPDWLEPDGDSGALAVCAGPSVAAGDRGVHPRADQCNDYGANRHLPSGIPRSGGVSRSDGGFCGPVRDRPHGTEALAEAGLKR